MWASPTHSKTYFYIFGGRVNSVPLPHVSTLDVRPEQMRKVFAQFMIENPAQQRDTSAVMALEKALYYGLCPGQEHGLIPHMEQCTKWGYDNGNLETRNDCDEAVAVQFMEQRKDVIERRLAPGEAFVTERTRGQGGGGWWMFTTCPVGHVSTPALSQENNEAIRASRYSCVHR